MTLYLTCIFFASLVVTYSDGFAIKSPSTSTSTSLNIKPYAVNLKLTVKPERRDEFIMLIKDNQEQTLTSESAALQYVVGEDTTTPNTFYIHEEFTGEQGFLDHRNTPHAANWVAFRNSKPFTEDGEPEFNFFEGFHEAVAVPVRTAYCLNVQLCVKPEVREEFLKVINTNEMGSNNDEGLCLQYVYGECKDVPNKFIFHEEYKGADDGKQGFDAHTTAPHFLVWEEFAATDPFTKPPVVDFFRTLP